MTFDELEALVRVQNAERVDRPLEMGDQVAWMTREGGRSAALTAVHRYFENGKTFCHLAVPPQQQHLSILPSLKVCGRCRALSSRAMHYARLTIVKASA